MVYYKRAGNEGQHRSQMEKSRSWPSAHDWKSCIPQKGIEGSNPSFSAKENPHPYGCGFSFCVERDLKTKNAYVRWTYAPGRLDGRETIVFQIPPSLFPKLSGHREDVFQGFEELNPTCRWQIGAAGLSAANHNVSNPSFILPQTAKLRRRGRFTSKGI